LQEFDGGESLEKKKLRKRDPKSESRRQKNGPAKKRLSQGTVKKEGRQKGGPTKTIKESGVRGGKKPKGKKALARGAREPVQRKKRSH